MAMTDTLSWTETDVPVSVRFDDPYYSRQTGREEVRHVFLAGNGLPERWRSYGRFVVAELGFGTGLSFLETCDVWQKSAPAAARLDFVSFEKYPLCENELGRAIAPWPDLMPLCEELCRGLNAKPGWNRLVIGNVRLCLAVGDANDLVDDWDGIADAWFLDGFSPNKNPDMWNEALVRAVAARTRPGGTFATFTAAGWVRRNLEQAGFTVRKSPGFGRKRDMTSGVRNGC